MPLMAKTNNLYLALETIYSALESRAEPFRNRLTYDKGV